MEDDKKQTKGLVLFSGGLDSILAVRIMEEQGCHVEGVTFSSPFFKLSPAVKYAEQIGLKLHVVDFTDDISELVQHPPHGFGGAMNPCIDCHARMIQRAGELVEKLGFDFIATGEVVNQRPMSQTNKNLKVVAATSGKEDILIRPLSAQLLPPTKPELDGKVDRSKLHGIEGRSRTKQAELVEHFGIKEHPSSGGGCLLTEKLFCRKLDDLIKHNLISSRRELELLKVGRHFRISENAKAVVGRDQSDNKRLAALVNEGFIIVHTCSVPGPTAAVTPTATEDDLKVVGSICASYGDATKEKIVVKKIVAGVEETFEIAPMPRDEMKDWML